MILHLDMDAFFASVEQLDNPVLRGKPVIVGQGQRGVVATASYEARNFGVRSAMPVGTARRLCPQGIFLRGRYARYSELSGQIMEALREFSPVVQKASIDEAYLDLKGRINSYEAAMNAGRLIKNRVWEVSGGLTCSVGLAPVKFLAKICSDINKPDGIFVLDPSDVDSFLLDLPVSRLPGVGKSMGASLAAIGVETIEQLRRLSRGFLVGKYGKIGALLHDRAYGLDPRPVHENLPPKSESSEHTFIVDTADKSVLKEKLQDHSLRVSASLKKRSLAGRTVTIKIKFNDFRQITRSKTLGRRIDDSRDIFAQARALLDAAEINLPVRLIGVCVSGFEARAERLFLPGLEPASIPAGSSLNFIK